MPNFYKVEINRTEWEVPQRYQMLTPVGSGAYGQVWWVTLHSLKRLEVCVYFDSLIIVIIKKCSILHTLYFLRLLEWTALTDWFGRVYSTLGEPIIIHSLVRTQSFTDILSPTFRVTLKLRRYPKLDCSQFRASFAAREAHTEKFWESDFCIILFAIKMTRSQYVHGRTCNLLSPPGFPGFALSSSNCFYGSKAPGCYSTFHKGPHI